MVFQRTLSFLRRLVRDPGGNVVIIVAASLPMLIGGAGLAVDTIEWVLTKRQLQQAVDSAAKAGVYSLIQSGDPSAAAYGTLEHAQSLDPRSAVSIDNPAPGHEQDPYAVHVRVTVPARLSFSGLFLAKPPLLSAEATATVVQNGKYCAFAIGSDTGTGVLVRSNAQVEGDCGIASNASSASSVKIEGGGSVKVGRLASFGGVEGQLDSDQGARTFGLGQKDPLADTESPPVPTSGCPNVTVNQGTGDSVTLQPGCYGNMNLRGTVWLQDGEYILNRGSFIVGPTAKVSCRACSIILTSDDAEAEPKSIGNVQIDKHATVQLIAPSQGPDAGLLLYQDRHAATDSNGPENTIGGNGFSKFAGLIYFPSQDIRIDGEFGPDVNCARFIGDRLVLEGRLYIGTNCSDSNIITFSGTEVQLIG